MITKYFIPKLEVSSDKEAIKKLGKILIEHGDVKPEYVEAVIAAEDNLATGIGLKNISIAIPHANNEYLINNSAIAIGILTKPVLFGSMIVVSETTPVNIVFLLAVKGADNQLAVIARLMKAFQDNEWLERFYNASSETDMRKVFDNIDIDGVR